MGRFVLWRFDGLGGRTRLCEAVELSAVEVAAMNRALVNELLRWLPEPS